MPSVNSKLSNQPSPSQSAPSNPNLPNNSQRSAKDQVSTEPSPAIISSSSNVTVHILSRRFLGPVPENIAHSADVQEKQRKIRDMRRKAVGKVLGRPGADVLEGSFGTTDDRRGVSKVVHRIRVRRRNKHGEEVEEDVEFEEESDEESGRFSKLKGKKKQKRKDVWVGKSFDIGQEFAVPAGTHQHEGDGPTANGIDHEDASVKSGEEDSGRPAPFRATTQETFVTARTQVSFPNDSSSMIANLDQDLDDSSPPLGRDDFAAERASTLSLPVHPRNSQGSSIQPLISNEPHHYSTDETSEGRDMVTPVKKPPGFKNRFKSAVKQSPGGSTELRSIASPEASRRAQTEARQRSKSVQFHVNPVTQDGGDREPPRKGNKQPADPIEVLEREGSAVAGTSAGAVEVTVEEDEAEVPMAGSVIMRDRILVRVGYHQKDGLKVVNEKTLRRDPTERLDHFEEYVAVHRKGFIELYQDYKTPLKERFTGHKQLCWTISLSPSRTSLSIFNATDMTFALTTSASKLDADVSKVMKSQKTVYGPMKAALKESRQYRWLQRFGKSGTHVFIMKVSERTRAADWFWETWKTLHEGIVREQLPTRLDVRIPQLATSVRLALPEEDEPGSAATLAILNPEAVIDTCWTMLEGVYDHDKLGRDTDVGLAWKTEDGKLDWLSFDTTVEGRPRPWAILAGLARQSSSLIGIGSVELQARRARHQPIWAKLEDGTVAQEPPGVEGFLIRHKTAAAPKDTVYIATHDGNVFTSHTQTAHPPLQPGSAQSLRRDVFPDLHEAHLDSERFRMAIFIQHSTGCVDLRDLEDIKLVSDLAESSSAKDEHSFEIHLSTGEKARFEAHSPEIAKEWVDRLLKLSEYWKRRHRIDARERMEVAKVKAADDPVADSDELLGDIWDWCTLKGCRPVTYAGRIYTKKSPYDKYRLRYVVLTGGSLVMFKIKKKQGFNQRKKVHSLFGSYCYSGRLAHDELHEQADGDAFGSHPRIYHDGLNSADGIEDTTFCLRLPSTAKTWGGKSYYSWDEHGTGHIPPLSKKAPALLFFRARSSLERDKWVWAINAEKERMVRSHTEIERKMRNHDKIPEN